MQAIDSPALAETKPVRSLRCHSRSVLRQVESLLNGWLQPWNARWLPANPTILAQNAPAGIGELVRVADRGMNPARALVEWMHLALFEEPSASSADQSDDPSPPSLAQTVARGAAEEWINALDARLGQAAWRIQLGAQSIASALPWSGDVEVHVSLAHVDVPPLRIVISCASIDQHVSRACASKPDKAREPLVHVIESVVKQTIATQVLLRPVEVSVGSLLTLKSGDTLVTSHKLTEPMRVTCNGSGDRDDSTLCLAHLGRRGPRRAIVLSPHGTEGINA